MPFKGPRPRLGSCCEEQKRKALLLDSTACEHHGFSLPTYLVKKRDHRFQRKDQIYLGAVKQDPPTIGIKLRYKDSKYINPSLTKKSFHAARLKNFSMVRSNKFLKKGLLLGPPPTSTSLGYHCWQKWPPFFLMLLLQDGHVPIGHFLL